MRLTRVEAGNVPAHPGGLDAAWQAPGAEFLVETGIAIEEYEEQVPALAAAELDRLYGSMFASMAQFRACGVLEGAHTYVVRRHGEVIGLWLFTREGRTVRVLNEGMRVNAEELGRFAGHIFRTHPEVDVINLHAVICVSDADDAPLSYPLQRYNCLEDIVLQLPESVEAYRATLGKSTRSYVNRYLNRMRRDFPDFEHRITTGADIDPQHLEQVFELNRARMKGKGKLSIIGDYEARRITQVALECGLLSVILIGGRICAGTVQYRMGDNYFMEVIAHDSFYNDYRLGTLCCYLAICACIERQGREYHFMWGKNAYKFRLGGVLQPLEHVTVYRSRWRLVCNGKEAVRHNYRRQDRRLRQWVQEAEKGEGEMARLVNKLQQWRQGGQD